MMERKESSMIYRDFSSIGVAILARWCLNSENCFYVSLSIANRPSLTIAIARNFKDDRPRPFGVVVSSPYESEGRDSSPSCVLLCFLGNVCVGYNTSRACPRLPIGQCDNGEREVVATWAAIRAKSLISSVVGDIYTLL